MAIRSLTPEPDPPHIAALCDMVRRLRGERQRWASSTGIGLTVRGPDGDLSREATPDDHKAMAQLMARSLHAEEQRCIQALRALGHSGDVADWPEPARAPEAAP